jgi:hypothetical protein
VKRAADMTVLCLSVTHKERVKTSSAVQVSVRCKMWAFGRSLVGIESSNPAGGMDVCVVCCTVKAKE